MDGLAGLPPLREVIARYGIIPHKRHGQNFLLDLNLTGRIARSAGRLDQAEFNERLDRAMKAKTRGDLSGLFADLPPIDEPGKAVKAMPTTDRRPEARRPLPRVLGLILIVVVTVIVARALMWPFFGLFGFFGHVLFVPVPWIVIAVIAFLCWRYATRHRRRS